jgi:hypothetical protein
LRRIVRRAQSVSAATDGAGPQGSRPPSAASTSP